MFPVKSFWATFLYIWLLYTGHTGRELIRSSCNKFYNSITTLCLNKALWMVERSRVTLNILSDCIISLFMTLAAEYLATYIIKLHHTESTCEVFVQSFEHETVFIKFWVVMRPNSTMTKICQLQKSFNLTQQRKYNQIRKFWTFTAVWDSGTISLNFKRPGADSIKI